MKKHPSKGMNGMTNFSTSRRRFLPACGAFLALLGLGVPAFAQHKDNAAVMPTEKLCKHLGPVVIEQLGRVNKGEAFRVGDLDHTKFGETGWIAGRVIAGKPVAVDEKTTSRLVAALLSDDTYFREDSLGTKTAVGYRFWTDDKGCVEVSFCIVKGALNMTVKDAKGDVVVKRAKGGFRGDLTNPLRMISQELFPDDKEVQNANWGQKKNSK
jgi:hypothetical protein